MNKVRILFFATIRDRAGTRSIEVEMPDGSTVNDIKIQVAQLYPEVDRSLPTALIAVNREYASAETILPANAEVAIFPAVSGG